VVLSGTLDDGAAGRLNVSDLLRYERGSQRLIQALAITHEQLILRDRPTAIPKDTDLWPTAARQAHRPAGA
jgi:hypothetical protein